MTHPRLGEHCTRYLGAATLAEHLDPDLDVSAPDGSRLLGPGKTHQQYT
jgi:hypothetical protein